MHKLMDYICDELEDLDRKVEENNNLSPSEVQYADALIHMKKNLLKVDEMTGDDEFSMAGGSYENSSYRNGSYARGGRSNNMRSYARGGNRRGANQYGSYAMGGYSRGADDMVNELRDLMQDAPDEKTKKEFERFIRKIEQM